MAQNFTQLQHINSKCSAVALCPKRDILATILADGTFAVYRFSVSNRTQERLLPHPDGNVHPKSDPLPAASATALGWSPDGGTLAVGYSDGAIVLVDIESNYCRLAASAPAAAFSAIGSKAAAAAVRWHTAAIMHLAWGAQQAPVNANSDAYIARETRAATSAAMGDSIRRLLPPPDLEGSAGLGGNSGNNRTNNGNSGGSSSSKSCVGGSGDEDEEGSHISGKNLVVLFAADAAGWVSLSAGGTFLVQQFQVSKKLGVSGALAVVSASFSPTLSSLTLCCNEAATKTSAPPRPSVVEVPTLTLWSRRHEIQMLSSKVRKSASHSSSKAHMLLYYVDVCVFINTRVCHALLFCVRLVASTSTPADASRVQFSAYVVAVLGSRGISMAGRRAPSWLQSGPAQQAPLAGVRASRSLGCFALS